MNLGLQEKVVLVTGASKGLGKAIVEAFAAEGSRVVLTARNQYELEQTTQEILRRGGQALALAADITNADDVNYMVNQVIARLGTVHVLINNAGSTCIRSRLVHHRCQSPC
ncbi:MAG: SDR family NAD(P)-dependent oxidoreductase [Ktedonobacteraceae bacterium]